MKYYLVTAKCGHVGKGKYIEVDFPIQACSKSEAAQKCLKRGKVKKQLKNAISSVYEITYNEYIERLNLFNNDIYVKAHTKREIFDYIFNAKDLLIEEKRRDSFTNRYERVSFVLRKNRIKESIAYV